MKKFTLIITALVLSLSLQAQKSIKERDILGEWIAESVLGLVSNVLDDLEIYFDFRKDGQVKVVAEIFGEREVEYSEWYINGDGELVIGETDIFDNDDDVWLMEGGRLVSYEHRIEI